MCVGGNLELTIEGITKEGKDDMTCVYNNSDPGLEVPLLATVILSLNLFFLRA